MQTTQADIRVWLEEAKRRGATHMLVVCDTWDYEDYPVFVKPGSSVYTIEQGYENRDMARVMEVYSLGRDLEAQLAEERAFHFD